MSTASMGKFDRLARGEKAEDRAAARSKKRKFLPTADKVGPAGCWLAQMALSWLTCFKSAERASDPTAVAHAAVKSWQAYLLQPGKHRQTGVPHMPCHAQGGVERQLTSKAVDRILAANADDIVDVKRAIGKFEVRGGSIQVTNCSVPSPISAAGFSCAGAH